MGHAFQQTLMDTLVRYHRMMGRDTWWQAGTDHAGIATQLVVERQLQKAGQRKEDLGREGFLEAVHEWKERAGGTMLAQMRRLGLDISWRDARFTMDAGYAATVRKIFVDLYRAGLLYRAKRLVNWDVAFATAISDLEVETREEIGSLWILAYELVGQEGDALRVATTRPETLWGDVAIAVHPEDERYASYVGRLVRIPSTDRTIPVIADSMVSPEFGTGAVKITPAHDVQDYEVAKRHRLPLIQLLDEQAKFLRKAEWFADVESLHPVQSVSLPDWIVGVDRLQVRAELVIRGDSEGWISERMDHKASVSYGDRSGALVEPRLTNQWFLRVKRLAPTAVEWVRSGTIRIMPNNYANQFFAWMENIEDWCISRQLWWGHRIPAWTDSATGRLYVGETEAEVRNFYQVDDNLLLIPSCDVLDTWFSSALWSFVSLDWPEKRGRWTRFYPTQVLITGFDILFFWVARMMMLSAFCFRDEPKERQIPFREVYVTGLIRDEWGQKMSKSKGNVLDPIDLIDGISLEDLIQKKVAGLLNPKQAERVKQLTKRAFPSGIPAFGTDALRLSLAMLATVGKDVRWDTTKLESARHFCNKLWNAGRLIFQQMATLPMEERKFTGAETCFDRWMQGTLCRLVTKQTVRRDFCDWYLEWGKLSVTQISPAASFHWFSLLLQCLHPLMPFLTEALWERGNELVPDRVPSLRRASFPKKEALPVDPEADEAIAWMQQVFSAIRLLRAEYQIPLQQPLEGRIISSVEEESCMAMQYIPLWSAMRGGLHWSSHERVEACGLLARRPVTSTATLLVLLEGVIDVEKESARIKREIDYTNRGIAELETKCSLPGFLLKAPKHVVLEVEEKRARLEEKRAAWEACLQELQRG